MTVRRICDRHGPHVERACPACKLERDQRRRKPDTAANRIRSSARWKMAQTACIRRDGKRCTYGLYAGDRGAGHYPDGRCPVTSRLQAHHKTPIEAGGAPFASSNLRAVCATHHAQLEAAYRSTR